MEKNSSGQPELFFSLDSAITYNSFNPTTRVGSEPIGLNRTLLFLNESSPLIFHDLMGTTTLTYEDLEKMGAIALCVFG